ncbi:hypothetical protein C0993_003705, partial [Termitomyces sp. T159_Od127]
MAVKDMSPTDRTVFESAWLERLITAAKTAGASVPTQKRKHNASISDLDNKKSTQLDNRALPSPKRTKTHAHDPIEISSDEEVPSIIAEPIEHARSQLQASIKQKTFAELGWKPWGEGEKQAHIAKEILKGAEARQCAKEREERNMEEKKERERILARERQRKHRLRLKAAADKEDNSRDVNDVLM